MADDSLSASEKYNVAAHFIKSSPPGQADKVAAEVATLVPDLPKEKTAAGYAAFHLANASCLTVPGQDSKLVVCKEAKCSDGSFLHTASKQRCSVDFVGSSATVAGPAEADDFPNANEGLRSALQSAMLDATRATYGKGENAEFGVAVVPQGDSLVVVLSASKARLSAFWSGRWVARYTVSDIGSGTAQLAGHLDVLTHYYEAGNVQLKSAKDWAAVSVSGGSDSDLAQAIVAGIASWEAQYETALQELFETMGSTTLKDLRRALPISGSKMNWNLTQHRTVGSLGQAAAVANA